MSNFATSTTTENYGELGNQRAVDLEGLLLEKQTVLSFLLKDFMLQQTSRLSVIESIPVVTTLLKTRATLLKLSLQDRSTRVVFDFYY